MSPKEWKHALEKWHSPREFRNKLHELRSEYGWHLLTKAGLTDLFRDAYCASVFASIRGADRVRLVKADQPDFETDLLGRTRMYEVVEADTPGRKRGDEINGRYQPAAGDTLPPDLYLTSELAPQILTAAAERKNRNCYLAVWGLLIYLNPCRPGGQEERDIEKGMAQATAAAKDRFAEVWVLWEGTAYNTWRNSAPGNTVLQPANPFVEMPDFSPEPLSSMFSRH